MTTNITPTSPRTIDADGRTAAQQNNADSDWLASLQHEYSHTEVSEIARAVDLARRAHAKQIRASGEPYLSHLMAVADILANLHMDSETIIAAILHDIVEDTEIDLSQIVDDFGEGIASLVDGVTKMAAINTQLVHDKKDEHSHAESLRKLLLAMANDVRVVLIKLADRLHNMRTLKFLDADKQVRIARETLDIYAPLANRLGIWQIKWELEDLSLRYIEPYAYKQIATFLDERRVDRERYIENIINIVVGELNNVGIQAVVTGRPKHIYSIWRKMKKKGVGFHDLYDVRAIRMTVKKVQDCYAALGVVHTLWRHIPKEFDDYIATPKENNYQSIHTAVIGPRGKSIEFQIRTEDMHEHAEWGVASHWRYKEQSKQNAAYDQKIAWLRQLLEWKDESDSAGDFIDRFKSEVFQERIYVLTPQGEVIDLAQGATPLDFAYHIHTEIGNRCRGARVDSRMVPLTYELKNGEQVEILTTKNGQPSRDWLNPQLGYLHTSRALAKARHWFKMQDYEKNVSIGHDSLEKELHRLGIRKLTHQAIGEHFHFQNTSDFLSAIGRGDINSVQIANAVNRMTNQTEVLQEPTFIPRESQGVANNASGITIQGVGNLLTRLANCCKPVQGDAIIGFITKGNGVTIHRKDCRNVLKMDDVKRMRLITVEWAGQSLQTSPVIIAIEAIDRTHLLRDIITVFSNESINVTSVNTLSTKKDNAARMRMTIEISDVNQLSRVLNKVGQLENILEARRVYDS